VPNNYQEKASMSQRVISGASPMGTLVLALSLQSCGGGGGGSAFNVPTPAPLPTPTFSVLSVAEVAAVKDDPGAYPVELVGVPDVSVVAVNGTGVNTFYQVNQDAYAPGTTTQAEVVANLTMPGDTSSRSAKIRLRGNTSRLAEQKSYRIKLASGAPAWQGETTLQFNKHPYDLSRMRNKLAFDLFRDIPHISSLRTQFYRMKVTYEILASDQLLSPVALAVGVHTDEDFGLFTHVEKMGKEYLAARNLPSSSATIGNIYKAEDFDFQLSAALSNYATTQNAANKVEFEKVLSLEADNLNHTPLIAMINDVNNDAIPFDTTFNKYFDKANYLTWLASNILMGNRDTINQNFGLYQPKDGTKFYFVPWDYDGAFGFEDQPLQLAGGPLYADWQKTVANWWGVPLHRRFLQDPKHLAELKLAVNEIYDNYLTRAQINAKLDAYKPLVIPIVKVLPDSRYLPVLSATTSNEIEAEWETERLRLANVVAANRDAFFTALEVPMPFWQAATFQSSTQVLFNWDAAVDLQGDAVTYTAQLATTPNFATGSVLVTNAQIGSNTTYLYTAPTGVLSGTYYLKVTASSKDAFGRTYVQNAFDRFDVGGTRYFGVSAHAVPP
jgi:spore coat protein H